MRRKKITNEEKVRILIQPFIRKNSISEVLECTAKTSENIYNNILIMMKQKNYRILDYNYIPTKLFLSYCELNLQDFIQAATIEQKLKGSDNIA